MKRLTALFSLVLFCGLILMACTPSPGPQPLQPAVTEPPTAQPKATAAPPQATATSAPPPPAPASPQQPQHANIPGDLPPGKSDVHAADHVIQDMATKQRAFVGDRFTNGRFERPINANTMDVYFPYLDLTEVAFYTSDATWVYSVISVAGRDAKGALAGKYALELDLNQDGRGEFLILVSQPASTEWSTQGVQIYRDANGDLGGVRPVLADSAGAGGDGYETLIFDQGQGDDPDAAWVRLSPNDANSFQVAFKKSLLGGEKTYLVGVWAASDLNPALFDLNDHFTHEQAGDALDSLAFYPIKGLSQLDNTCRVAIGFNPSGKEPGVCPVQ